MVSSDLLDDKGICPITQPFWIGFPHCDISLCLTPNILHQLHEGVFKSHLCSWCTSLSTESEVDAHFQAMTTHPSLWHFKKGISTILQWSGAEYKHMEKTFVGLISGSVSQDALHVAHALLDFIYLAQYPSHSMTTLQHLHEALTCFHEHKDRLHIDLAKVAYHASSCRDYIIRMTNWIT
ncbi:hypothetical protein K439DRAFT_1649123 [Ramaria rubella]|nr:hypothetical protein K439DRAFT_1649123 [Ramaria rubella]